MLHSEPGSREKVWLSTEQKAILPLVPLLLIYWKSSAAKLVTFLLCQYVCVCTLRPLKNAQLRSFFPQWYFKRIAGLKKEWKSELFLACLVVFLELEIHHGDCIVRASLVVEQHCIGLARATWGVPHCAVHEVTQGAGGDEGGMPSNATSCHLAREGLRQPNLSVSQRALKEKGVPLFFLFFFQEMRSHKGRCFGL